jgi:predicted enzyme related to lactoylglutathione lyase
MGRVVHFEIHADEPERAAKFYGDVFGWDIKKMNMGGVDYWLVSTGKNNPDQPTWGGIDGGIVKRRGKKPAYDNPVSAFVCTVDVNNLDKSSDAVVKHGGNIVVEKEAIPGMGWLTYAKDSEGNIFGMMQSDKEAK